MRCPSCQTENSSQARFCRACGSGLVASPACPQCRAELPLGAKFCKSCGQALQPAAPAAQVLATQPRLVCVLGALQGMTFRVGEGIVLGRAADVDVVVDDPEVSKRHAWVGMANGRLTLRDLRSTNGTYLNDDLNRPITECELREGDLVVLGKHDQEKFRVTLSG